MSSFKNASLKLMGNDEGDREFGGEVSLESTVYWWHEKYKPRKPKYFNRVHTGELRWGFFGGCGMTKGCTQASGVGVICRLWWVHTGEWRWVVLQILGCHKRVEGGVARATQGLHSTHRTVSGFGCARSGCM